MTEDAAMIEARLTTRGFIECGEELLPYARILEELMALADELITSELEGRKHELMRALSSAVKVTVHQICDAAYLEPVDTARETRDTK